MPCSVSGGGVSSHPGARTLAPHQPNTATLLLVLLAAVLFLLTYAPPCASMCRLCRARTDANTQPSLHRTPIIWPKYA